MATFTAPDNCTSITIGESTYKVNKKGQVDIPNGTPLDQITAHGFVLFEPTATTDQPAGS